MSKNLHIYFIQGVSGGPIKIGKSADVERRLLALQAGCPVRLSLLHSEPGTDAVEIALHAKFQSCRLHGEWFEATEELLAYIAERATSPGRLASSAMMYRVAVEQPPEGYWDYGNPGWDRLVAASKALG